MGFIGKDDTHRGDVFKFEGINQIKYFVKKIKIKKYLCFKKIFYKTFRKN